MSGAAPGPYPLTDPETGALSWRDAEGGVITIVATTRTLAPWEMPVSMITVAGHELSLWNARMLASALCILCHALDRQ